MSYSKRSLREFLGRLKDAYSKRSSDIKIVNFKGCKNFLCLLENEGFISGFEGISSSPDASVVGVTHYKIHLKYDLKTGRGVIKSITTTKYEIPEKWYLWERDDNGFLKIDVYYNPRTGFEARRSYSHLPVCIDPPEVLYENPRVVWICTIFA